MQCCNNITTTDVTDYHKCTLMSLNRNHEPKAFVAQTGTKLNPTPFDIRRRFSLLLFFRTRPPFTARALSLSFSWHFQLYAGRVVYSTVVRVGTKSLLLLLLQLPAAVRREERESWHAERRSVRERAEFSAKTNKFSPLLLRKMREEQ